MHFFVSVVRAAQEGIKRDKYLSPAKSCVAMADGARGVERQRNMDNTKGRSTGNFVAIAGDLDVGRYTYVKRHNYVSFAATGNKFRRFAREITGDLQTIIHCPAGTERRCGNGGTLSRNTVNK